MLAFDWLEQTENIGCKIFIFACENDHSCAERYAARLFGNTFLNFAQCKSFPENRGSEMRVSGSGKRIGGAS